MTKPNWIIKRSVLLTIGVSLIVYAILAELLDFHLISLRIPGDSRLNHRLEEITMLWWPLCSVAGWILALRKQIPKHNVRILPMVIVPIVISFWLSSCEVWERYQKGAFRPPSPGLPNMFWFEMIGILIPLILGGLFAGLLWFQARHWRKLGLAGVCYECGYDLTGNVSGRCPECGTQISKKSIGLHISTRWYPELLVYETAEERDNTWKASQKQIWINPYLLIGMAFVALMALSLADPIKQYLGSLSWLLYGIGILGIFASAWLLDRHRHRILRHKAREAGYRICMKCGTDLRKIGGDKCPKCGTVDTINGGGQ